MKEYINNFFGNLKAIYRFLFVEEKPEHYPTLDDPTEVARFIRRTTGCQEIFDNAHATHLRQIPAGRIRYKGSGI